MIDADTPEIWFVAGAQHLYGPGPLRQVASNAEAMCAGMAKQARLPLPLQFKGVLTTSEEVLRLCRAADGEPRCAGLVLWMHTFSPARMWIRGLQALRKPFAHLHTQFNRDLPWDRIDMDFMNLNQSAHGDREAAHLHARLRLRRKIVVGYWSDADTLDELGGWMRTVRAWHDWQGARFVRFGDNMRQVAVTDGDKAEAEARFGFTVDGHGVGDLAAEVAAAPADAVAELCRTYEKRYRVAPELRRGAARHASLEEAARIELGLRAFLERGRFKGFTTTFEDLHGLRQLPGFAVQRLMADGYGFGAEGDWKTCALLRAVKVMAEGLGPASFMEDYTYHFGRGGPLVLGAHMLEVCESIAAGKPSVEIHPLGIGGKEDPVRSVFTARPGPAVNVSLIDLGDRFRLIAADVDVIAPPKPLPRLPVARAIWTCRPDFRTATAAWLRAGGAHHTVLAYGLDAARLRDFADLAGIEAVSIGADTRLADIENSLRWNEAAYAPCSRN